VDAANVVALGLDAGSTTMKVVGVDEAGAMAWHWLEPAEARVREQAERMLARAHAAGAPWDAPVAATGCGRALVGAAGRALTEITCHARGLYRAAGHGGTLVDVGGQDSKVIAIAADGAVLDFAMNDKCAAGTGRFLENTARRLGVPLAELGPRALRTKVEAAISSTCTVFAETEIISRIALGADVDEILRGLHRALARRVAALARGVGVTPPVLLSGGVALNPAVAALLGEELGSPARAVAAPQLLGAYGAAMSAGK
jgi:predicted CoA-substrate-specific enzyme activase